MKELPVATSSIKVRRSTENMIDTYHIAEAYPAGRIDEVILWRTPDGYFGIITQKGARPIPFENYPSWREFKNDLMACLHEELQSPEFDNESQLSPPFLRRSPDAR